MIDTIRGVGYLFIMKYIITEGVLDRIIFHYLDLNLKGLKIRKSKYHEGFIFAYPDEICGILVYRNDVGTLHIYYELIEEISSVFGLDYSDSISIISRWVSNRLKLEVMNAYEMIGNMLRC